MSQPSHISQPYRPARRPGLIASLILGLAVALCIGGGLEAFALVQDAQPRGSTDPKVAVDGFLSAVFSSHSPAAAADFVCSRNRNVEELTKMVERIRAFEEQFESPRTSWDTQDVEVNGRSAATTVRLRLTVDAAQVAEERLRLKLVEQRGWFVCEVEQAG
jgi:hypothetical protein